MAQSIWKSETAARSGPFGPNGAVLLGKLWTVAPLLPTSRDKTPQAAAFRALNAGKTLKVRVWPAVRFGQPAVGDLRFQAAAAYAYPAGVHRLADVPPPPYQRYSKENGSDGRTEFGRPDIGEADWTGMGTAESEDCLFMAVTAPLFADAAPCVFGIPGGSWTVNHAWSPQFNAAYLAAHKGLVVCIINYRRGIFGNFPHPDLAVTGEPSVAYTDIKLAQKTFFDNAAAFGGDPLRICNMGTSAGGAAVLQLMEDDEAQPWFSSVWVDSGGGSGLYWDRGATAAGLGYDWLMRVYERSVRATAAVTATNGLTPYQTLQEAIDAMGFGWAMQHAARVSTLQDLAEARASLTTPSIYAAIEGSGPLAAGEDRSFDDRYPYKRSAFPNAIEAAKAGRMRKPGVYGFAEAEGQGLKGDDYLAQMWGFLDLPLAALDSWAQRVGYADYAAWCGGAWLPEDGLWSLGSSQYMDDFGGVADLDLNSEIADLASVTEVRISYVPEEISISGAVLVDSEWIVTGNDFTGVSALSPVGHASYEVLTVRVYRLGLLAESFPIRVLVINVGDTENRRVLFTDAVFGYPAWRIARACAETGSAPAWVIKNNQSLNSIFAGHSTMVSFLFGTPEWQVGGVLGEGASADANLHMDGLYSAEIMMQKLAALAATGNPNGAYHYDGFTLFSDPATRPTDGGAITGSMTPYALSQPDMADTFGKAAPGTKLLNAGTFYPNETLDLDGTLHPANTLDFESTRQCKITRETLGGAYLEYLGLLEP